MNTPHIQWLDYCRSTNTYMASMPDDTPGGTVIAAVSQTAGRGQRGNSWEAEPGANLTFSMLLRPEALSPRRQFELSMIVSLAVVGVLDRHLPEHEVSVKWPNDIYVGDRKLVGILIENTLQDNAIVRSIAGIGINVNQKEFLSDAPNPVSMTQITGLHYDLPALLEEVTARIGADLDAYSPDSADRLVADYMARLWRRKGFHPYVETATAEHFSAEICAVESVGTLVLRDTDDHLRHYAFKEVHPIL